MHHDEHDGCGTSSEYAREWLRNEQGRSRLRSQLLEGAASAPGEVADDQYFEGLREGICRRAW